MRQFRSINAKLTGSYKKKKKKKKGIRKKKKIFTTQK